MLAGKGGDTFKYSRDLVGGLISFRAKFDEVPADLRLPRYKRKHGRLHAHVTQFESTRFVRKSFRRVPLSAGAFRRSNKPSASSVSVRIFRYSRSTRTIALVDG